MNDEIKVSIICNTYNHEKFIRDALDSFVNQKTNFPCEILIHDDASTDDTSRIIKAYWQKYPDLIYPIFQKSNQYSQGIKISQNFQFPRVRGKYVATCEGDDYWIDSYKLQKQYDALESNQGIDICAHSAIMLHNGKKYEIERSKKDKLFSPEDVILGGGGFVATSSLMYRKELNDAIPPFRVFLPLDYTLQIHGALRGGMLYLHEKMSVYRLQSSNSAWSSRMAADSSSFNLHIQKIIKMLEILNEDTDYHYNESILKRIEYVNFLNLRRQNKFGEILSNRKIMDILNSTEKAKIFVKYMLQKVHF